MRIRNYRCVCATGRFCLAMSIAAMAQAPPPRRIRRLRRPPPRRHHPHPCGQWAPIDFSGLVDVGPPTRGLSIIQLR